MSSAHTRFRTIEVWLLVVASLATAAATTGCGIPPQMGAKNYRLGDSLRTAISAHRLDWLDATAKEIEQRTAAGGRKP